MKLKDEKNFYKVEAINEAVRRFPEETAGAAENNYHSQLRNAAEAAKDKRILMLAGPSGSGKTTTALKLKQEFENQGRNADVVSLDNFYKNRSTMPIVDGERNAEVIEALELEMIRKAILSLIETGETSLPEYDFITGQRKDNAAFIKTGKNDIVIIEGIHALNGEIRESLPGNEILNVYVSPHSGFAVGNRICLTKRQARLIRRMVRDSWSRGSDAEDTLKMWPAVCKGEDLYIRPSSKYADFRIDSTYAFEPCLFRDQAKTLLNAVPESSCYFAAAKSMSARLDNFEAFDPSYLSETSLLREFYDTRKM